MGFSVHRGRRDSESLYSDVPTSRVTVYVGDATGSALDIRIPSAHVTVVIDESDESEVAAGAEGDLAEGHSPEAGEDSSPTTTSEEE